MRLLQPSAAKHLQYNPLGQQRPDDVRPLKLLVLPVTGSGCYYKCLTTLWKGKILLFFLPFAQSDLFVTVSDKVWLKEKSRSESRES